MNALSELIRRAQSGQVSSIESLFSQYSALIERECGKFGVRQYPDWSQSDLIQEVYLKVWTKIGQFNGNGEPEVGIVFEQWLRKTARSAVINLLRQQNAEKRRPRGGLQSFEEANGAAVPDRNHQPTASSIFAIQENAERTQAAMETYLDEPGRQILMLRIVNGLSFKQISERLALTYDQVRYKFQASLAELEKRLKDSRPLE